MHLEQLLRLLSVSKKSNPSVNNLQVDMIYSLAYAVCKDLSFVLNFRQEKNKIKFDLYGKLPSSISFTF